MKVLKENGQNILYQNLIYIEIKVYLTKNKTLLILY